MDPRSLPSFVQSYKDSVSFFVAYMMQIVTQHLLHAFLVYGLETINTREKYIKTLAGQFSAYGFALIGSTILNLVLLRMGVEKTVAFFGTMLIFSLLNYFLIGWIVRRAVSSDEAKRTSIQGQATVQQVQRGGAFLEPKNDYCWLLFVRETCHPVDEAAVNGSRLDDSHLKRW